MNKKEIYKLSCFAFAFLILSAVLAVIYIQAEKIKTKKLGDEIQKLLTSQGYPDFVADHLILKTPAQTSTVMFALKNKSGKKSGFVCLIRITGICGPVPAVFVCDADKNIGFVGIPGEGMLTKEVCALTDMQVSYWTSRISTFAEVLEK
ncbi:hypothetical protein H0R92_00585 [Treponema sp. OMZ 840]|uniref:hypothetical protein n=1 Tax=Treponema sp. OMZ 840 TaxID=244313 RepID=UPI003D89F7DA